MSDITKSIESFLKKNGLSNTLKVFQSEAKRSSTLQNKNSFAPLVNLKTTKIASDEESQNKLR